MNSPDDKQLREDYRALKRDAPTADSDARILAEAHRAIRPRRHPVAWAGLVGLAAAIGFSLVLLPQLLVDTPREMSDEVAQAPARSAPQAERVDITSAGVAKTDTAAATAQRERVANERAAAEKLLAADAMESVAEDRAAAIAQAVEESGPDLAALRAELEGAPEPQWRATLVALRDSGSRALAEQLMPTYRAEFDLDESLTLDMLVAEVQ